MRVFLKRITAFVLAAVIMIAAQVQIIPGIAAEANNGKKVLLIQDNIPWKSEANTKVLSSIGVDYQKVTTDQFLEVNLEDYALVIFANDQAFSTYNNYLQFKEYMELYASLGGVIIFGASDAGWAEGSLTGALPGNVEKIHDYANYNYVSDMKHPIITAELSDGNGADVEGKNTLMWTSNYCSHSEFKESTLPAGSNILVRSTKTDNPTLVEYPLGNGRVIASGLTWEHSYEYKNNYAGAIMDDLFLYALRVSDFDGAAADQLSNYRVSVNKHYVIVNSSKTKKPIPGAKVQIGDKTYTADDKGMVAIDGMNTKETVTVSAKGYITTATIYTIKRRSAHFFYLKDDDSNGRPYAIMATETNKEKDLFTKNVTFTEKSSDICKIKVMAEWNGHTPGTYELVQYGTNVKLTSSNGNFSFKPGFSLKPDKDVYLVLRSADGSVSAARKLYLKVGSADKAPDIDTSSFNNQFKVTPDQSGTTGSEDVASLVGDNFQIEFPCLPVCVKSERNDDEGTCTVRLLIGVDAETVSKSNGIADYFKNSFNDALEDVEKAGDLIESLCQKINTSHKLTATGSLGVVPDASLNVLGYYEWVYDANKTIVSQGGGIAVTVGGELSYTQQFLLAIVPIYINVTGGAELEARNGIMYDAQAGSCSYDGSVSITVSISLSAGVGINGIVSVGVGGGGEFKIGISPSCTGEVTLKAFIEAYLLFVIDYSYDFASHTWKLWPKENERSLNNRMNAVMNGDDKKEIGMVNMDYLNNESAWNGSVNNKVNVLKSSVLPSTIPVIAEAGDSKVMVWQTTDPNAEAVNSTKLMYSYFNNGVWTDPQPVNQSDSADLNANLVKNGNDIYLIWAKQNEVISADDIYQIAEKAASSADIFTAKWNGSKFDEVSCVLDDDTMDMLPTLAFDGSKITAVWAKYNGSILDLSGCSSTIMAADLTDGKWGTPYVIAETDKYVSELDAAYVDGKLCTAYISSDMNDISKNELHIVTDGKNKTVSCESDIVTGITFNNGRIYCAADGKLCSAAPSDSSLTAVKGDLKTLTGSYSMADDGSSLVFSDGSKFYISVNENGTWSHAIEAGVPDGFSVFNYSATGKNGSYTIVMNGRDSDKKASLVCINAAFNESIGIKYADVLTDFETGEQSVIFKVENIETKSIEALNIELSNADGSLFSIQDAVSIAPGQSKVLEYPVDIKGITSATDFDLVVTDGIHLANTKVTLGKPDIALNVETYYDDDSVVLAIKASNLTNSPAEAALKIYEDSLDGVQIEMKNAGVINNEEDYLLLEQINFSEIKFNEDGVKHLFIKADTIGDELNLANNTVAVAIYKPDDAPDGDESGMVAVDVTDTEGDNSEGSDATTTTTTTTTTTASTTKSTEKSPNTGDNGMNTVAVFFAALSVAAGGLLKKKRTNK